jgi:hypothetical protein
MGSEPSHRAENRNEGTEPVDPNLAEAIDRIKHPPAMDDVLSQMDPVERIELPGVAPEMFDVTDDLRDDLRRDDSNSQA